MALRPRTKSVRMRMSCTLSRWLRFSVRASRASRAHARDPLPA